MVLHNKKLFISFLRSDDKTKSLRITLHEIFENTFNSSKSMETLLSRN